MAENVPENPAPEPPATAPNPPDAKPPRPPTPLSWRLAIGGGVLVLVAAAYALEGIIGPRGVAAIGILVCIGAVAAFCSNLRDVNWRTVIWGFALQFVIGFLIIKVELVKEFFDAMGKGVEVFTDFTYAGSTFVFGKLADVEAMEKIFGKKNGFVFAFRALPTIIFISSFFTMLYHFGVLQFVVKLFAKGMIYLMGTSGAETLSAVANVFMGQTEAPLIVRPYVGRMTRSELLCLMVAGMATLAASVIFVYIEMKADVVAILATSVMAAPGSLFLSKLLIPETEVPETGGQTKITFIRTHDSTIDAIVAGATEGMYLALNVAAMLIAFLAFLAMVNFLLGKLPGGISLEMIFAQLFAPLAFLMGVDRADIPQVANLLGIKLAANEFVAFIQYGQYSDAGNLTETGKILATYALSGFANFASIGIQVGGIGAMAPHRRAEMARLGWRALFVGFLVTQINASIAGMLIDRN